MCNGYTRLGIVMEDPCHYWNCKSFAVLYCYICTDDNQLVTHLDLDCYRVCMLSGYFDCASAYPSTSAVILT